MTANATEPTKTTRLTPAKTRLEFMSCHGRDARSPSMLHACTDSIRVASSSSDPPGTPLVAGPAGAGRAGGADELAKTTLIALPRRPGSRSKALAHAAGHAPCGGWPGLVTAGWVLAA